MAKKPKSEDGPANAGPDGIDWKDFLSRAKHLDRPLSDEELTLWKQGKIDGNARMWNVEYVHASQRAIEGREPDQLRAMMIAEIPIPPFLLPIVALLGTPVHRRPSALTVHDDAIIRQQFEMTTCQHGFFQFKPSAAVKWIADRRGVSSKTIARSLTRTRPD